MKLKKNDIFKYESKKTPYSIVVGIIKYKKRHEWSKGFELRYYYKPLYEKNVYWTGKFFDENSPIGLEAELITADAELDKIMVEVL